MLQGLVGGKSAGREPRQARLLRIALSPAERREIDELVASCRLLLDVEDHHGAAAAAARVAGLRADGQLALVLASARLGAPALLDLVSAFGPAARDRPPMTVLADIGDGLVVEAMRETCHADWLFAYDLARESVARALELAYERASRLRAEEDLSVAFEASRRELAAVLSRIAEGVLFIDPQLRVERASRRAAELLGRGQRELVGLPFTALGWSEPVRARTDLAKAASLDGALLELEDAGGQRRQLLVRVYRLASERGSALGVRRMVVLSEPGAAQQVADQLAARLTLAVAHDLGNVLTPVLGHADLLRTRLGEKDAGGRSAAEIVRSAELAIELVRSLHAAHGSLGALPERWQADLLVARLGPLLQALAGSRVQLALALEAPGARIFVRPADLARVLLNLAANARDAIVGDGSIAVLTSRGAFGEWVLEVIDTGVGMPAIEIERIFQPGYSTKGSTGLGLAIVRSLLEEAGAEISVESEPGHGTRIRVVWPTDGADAQAADP